MPPPAEVTEELGRLNEHYDAFEENDRGANGYLFFARNRITQQDVAIKFYSGQPGREHDEPRQLATIVSPNVLPILDARHVSEEWAFFVTPRCREGDLDDLIASGPSIHRGLDVALGVCRGVSAIHANGMLHRDLKPANVVIEGGVPRIADFGSVKKLAVGCLDTTATRHSVLYRPPESFGSNRYDLKGEVYQLGLVTYQLLGGTLH
jgi:serine/threonine protein kinase